MYINIALLDIYFILWIIIQYYQLLYCSHSLVFGFWNSFSLAPFTFWHAPILFHALPVFLSPYLEPWVHSDTFFSSLNTIWFILSFFLICNFFPSDTEKPELALSTIYLLVCSYRIAKLYSCENQIYSTCAIFVQYFCMVLFWFSLALSSQNTVFKVSWAQSFLFSSSHPSVWLSYSFVI